MRYGCGDQRTTAIPSPSAITTDTPEQPTEKPEPTSDEAIKSFILPSATPAPTVTPGAATELISEFTQATGLQEVTVFRIGVEDWLNLGLSILQVFVIGYLLSRLVYFVLSKAAARTETSYDDVFIK